MERFVWDLNLDAEFELATRGSYTRSRAAERFVVEHRGAARAALAPGDLALGDPGLEPELCAAAGGRAWCPTPSALERLRAAGVSVPPAPGLEVLRAVNDRAFCAELGQTLEYALHSSCPDELRARIESSRGPGLWLAKRAFGVAGRGRRKITAAELSEADLRWLSASLKSGGVQLEPWLEVRAEFTVQGLISQGFDACPASLRLGPPRVQLTDGSGAWLETRDAGSSELSALERESLLFEAQRVGAALIERDYFGPFGLDALRYVLPGTSELRFQPRSEINARYTMGWNLAD